MTDDEPGLAGRTDPPGPSLRLLPWTNENGRPCYLSTDDGDGLMSRLADDIEAAQLESGARVLAGAREVLGDARAGEHAVRFALARSTESLQEALRIADSRGGRLVAYQHSGA